MTRTSLNESCPVAPRRRAWALGSVALTLLAACAGCVGNADSADSVPGEDSGTEDAAITGTQLTVTLQTYAGNYLVADKGGGAALMAYSTAAKAWETFTLGDLNGGSLVSGDVVTLRSTGGQWASAINGGGSAVNFTAPWEQAWEKFSVVKLNGSGKIVNGDKIALKTTVSGQFVSVINAGGGAVVASAPRRESGRR